MVRRYPHRAMVEIREKGRIIRGEAVEGKALEKSLRGVYYPTNSANRLKTNSLGDEVVVHGEFSTPTKKIADATRLHIPSIGLDAPIIAWEQFQTHSVVYV